MANIMYPAKVNSPKTTLSSAITATATTIAVADVTKLPAAPNIFTILNGDGSETVSYAAVDGSNLTGCVRGLNGTAKAWTVGTEVSRTFTAYDHDAFISQITDLVSKTVAASINNSGIVQLSSALTSTDETKAATPKAVKTAKDAADAAKTAADNNKTYIDNNFVKNIGTQSIELGVSNPTTASPAYIDFHSGATYVDYDARIISIGGDGSSGHATLSIQSSDVELVTSSGAVYASRLTRLMVGSGQPEGVVNALVGTIYLNTAGGTSTSLYVKETGGGGNTGWKAK
ncbi:phage tail protein [Paenibacillus wenxiniae]|uniref:Phage tail protein n=1 Tax=Paenibacillus wenxiniae TaxID=1636843 RepID=A0ABW4RIP6_9BACL